MARPAKFSEADILDATLCLVAEGGPGAATVAAIAACVGAPVGSLYHRFRSRELLLARLWLRTIRRFQEGFMLALAAPDVDAAATDAALHTVRWAREHLDQARLLVLFRRRDLAEQWPAELGAELLDLNTQVDQAMREFTRRRYDHDDPDGGQRITFALVDLPYAAVRRWLGAGVAPPSWVDELVVTASRCILDGGTPGSPGHAAAQQEATPK